MPGTVTAIMQQPEADEESVGKQHEDVIRRLAKRMGFAVLKSREAIHINNEGLFRLFDQRYNRVVLGIDFEATMEEIEEYLGNLDSDC